MAGWVVLCDDNTYSSQGLPSELTAKLDDLRARGAKLKSVTFHPAGGWVVLYDKNGHASSGIPKACADKLDDLAARGAELRSVVFSPWWEGRGWVILHGKNGHAADHVSVDWLDELARKDADVTSFALTRTGGCVILYDKNSYRCDNEPAAEKELKALASKGAQFRSVTFTDWKGYAILTDRAGEGIYTDLPQDMRECLKKLVDGGKTPRCVAIGRPDLIRLSRDDADTRAKVLELMGRYKVPGLSIAVIDKGAVAWARAYGVVAPGGKPVTPGTRFQAASISKAVTAVAALRLVEQGKLALDDDFNKYLVTWKIPASPYTVGHPVTLREILSHTAGLTVHGFLGYRAGVTPPTLVQLLNGQPPANSKPIVVGAPPGKGFRYSGGGYCVLQQAMLDVTGKAFPQIMYDSVLAPLHMTDSTYEQPLPADLCDAAAVGTKDGKPIAGNWRTHPEMSPAGLWTTPSDLARFVLALQRAARGGEADAILRPDTVRQMLARQVEIAGAGDAWGLGVSLHGRGAAAQFGHDGRNVGFDSNMIGYVSTGQGVVIMINANETGGLIDALVRDIRIEYGWPD
jgi:CubicO group peptidase (beta-lactamase class C family)